MIENIVGFREELRLDVFVNCEQDACVTGIHLVDVGTANRIASDEEGAVIARVGRIAVQGLNAGRNVLLIA